MKGFSSHYSTNKSGHVFGCSFVIGAMIVTQERYTKDSSLAPNSPYCKVNFCEKAGGTFYVYYLNAINKVTVIKSRVLILDQLFTCLNPSEVLKKDIF